MGSPSAKSKKKVRPIKPKRPTKTASQGPSQTASTTVIPSQASATVIPSQPATSVSPQKWTKTSAKWFSSATRNSPSSSGKKKVVTFAVDHVDK